MIFKHCDFGVIFIQFWFEKLKKRVILEDRFCGSCPQPNERVCDESLR